MRRTALAALLVGLILEPQPSPAVGGETITIAQSQAAAPAPPRAYGQYQEFVEDMRVKVLGGYLRVTRTFDSDQWHFNRRWDPLKEIYETGTPDRPAALERNGVRYSWLGGRYTDDTDPGQSITRTATASGATYRWRHRLGNWIDYDETLRVTAYGDRNDVTVTLQYNTAGKLSGALDHVGRQILFYEYHPDGQLSSVRDYSGRQVRYQYTGGRLTTVLDVLGNPWTYTYEGNRLKTKTDPEGRTTTIQYAANGTVSSVLRPDGLATTTRYEYDKTKRQFYRQEKSPSGKTTETWYDADGDIVRKDVNGATVYTVIKDGRRRIQTDAAGNRTIEELDEFDNTIKVTHADGSTLSRTFEPVYSNLLQQTNENNVATHYEYDPRGNRTKMTEALGTSVQRSTTYSHDQYGNLTLATQVGDAATQASQTAYTYDSYGNIFSLRDGEGHTTHFTYDAMGNVLTKIDARNHTWTSTYDAAGQLLSETDPLNHSTRYVYDRAGLLAQRIDPLDNVIHYSYDNEGNLTSLRDPYGGQIRYEYNQNGQRTKIIDQEGVTETFGYTPDGDLAKIVDGSNNETSFRYGAPGSNADRLRTEVIYPTHRVRFSYDTRRRNTHTITVDAQQTERTTITRYDSVGNRISVTNPLGKTSRYRYDALNRLVEITDPAGGVTTHLYNRRNLIGIRNAEGHLYQFEYDRRNLRVKEVWPLGNTFVYTYDEVGNLTSAIDAKGQLRRIFYDAANRPLREAHYPNVQTPTPTRETFFSFNALNTLTGFRDGTTATTILYDGRGLRATGSAVDYGPFSLRFGYTYYGNGALKTYTNAQNETVTYHYDGAGMLSSVQLPVGAVTINQRLANRPTRITMPGGAVRALQYDSFLQLTNLEVYDPGSNVVLDHHYSRDLLGTVASKVTPDGTEQYTYDDLHRLTEVRRSGSPSPSFAYDRVHNRIASNDVAGPWTYDENNQLRTYGDVQLDYDGNGNVIREVAGTQVTVYEYDLQSRLTAVRDGAGNAIAAYYYDAAGQRLWKDVGGTKTYFLYSEEGLIGEYDQAGRLIREYGYLPDTTWTSDVAYIKPGARPYLFPQNDHLGVPVKILTTEGQVVWSGGYDPFGQMNVDPTSTEINDLRLPGQYYDLETGLHYNHHRYYNPATGRYLTSDPIGLEGGPNPYVYALANPLAHTDPHGLDTAGCDIGPLKVLETPCRLECCAVHDRCYDNFNCTSGSWINDKGCNPEQCDGCNADARRCFVSCGPTATEVCTVLSIVALVATRGRAARRIPGFFRICRAVFRPWDKNNIDDPTKPNYYCPAEARYIDIPGDYPDQDFAEAACEYDHGADCAACPGAPPGVRPRPAI